MLNLLLVSSAVASVPSQVDLGRFEITEVTRHEAFAGRLGKRITERLEVRRDGKDYQVIIDGAFHSRMGGRQMPRLSAGDSVRLRGSQKGSIIRVNWDGVRKS